MSVNVGVLRNVLQHFNFICAQSWWKNLIAILWKKRIPVSYLSMKILSQYTVNCRRRKSNGRDSSFFCLTINPFNKSYDSSWQSSLPFAVFSKTNERKMLANFNQTQCPVFKKISASHRWTNTPYSALSLDRINFWNMVHLHFDFTFNEKPL